MSTIKHGLNEIGDALAQLGASRVLILTGPSRRFVDLLGPSLGPELAVFDGAVRHVPEAVVEAASARLLAANADALIAIGGGSTVGLAKALRLRHDVRFVAVPTTYSGSERTNLYGITREQNGVPSKQTGRDDRVRPDVIVYDGALLAQMPVGLTITSLMNATAHALSVFSRPEANESLERRASSVIGTLFTAMETLVRAPTDTEARRNALAGAGDAAALLEGGSVGRHHQLVHRLGGEFDLEHSALHSVLLPYSVHELRREHPEKLRDLATRIGVWDLEGQVHDLLKRARAKTSLSALGLPASGFDRVASETPIAPESAYRLAPLGRRPSASVRYQDVGARLPLALCGEPLENAQVVVLALHGRDSSAEVALAFARECSSGVRGLSVVAPQAPGGEWYRGGYSQPNHQRTTELDAAMADVSAILSWVEATAPQARCCLLGFSQGACVALELLATAPRRFDVVAALSGARVVRETGVTKVLEPPLRCKLLLGISAGDGWVSTSDVEAAAREFSAVGHAVELLPVTGSAHALHALHRLAVCRSLRGQDFETQGGLGGAFESEALPDALPREQNSPRQAPYGLYPEQLSGTGFTAPRHKNQRSWLYRVRPSAQSSAFAPLAHSTFTTAFVTEPAEPNLCGWRPCPIPSDATDFVDGIVTLGGAGDPRSRRGYALHWFAANRSMDNRAFCNADGDFLLVPQSGELTLLTEFGALEVSPGSVALLPRGLRYSVVLRSPSARGFVAEVYGRHFELPERGVIGANGLADARHFRAPTAWFEDRMELDYRVVQKLGGQLYEARQDYSPFDVVAWHGNYAPLVYDLRNFVPVSNARVDHADPSIYSVLSCPLDETGSNLLDLIVFPPRWDVTEHTFRPPYFHRNATMEWNAVIRDPASDAARFAPGVSFLTPPMTPHGVMAAAVERALRQDPATADIPHRNSDQSLWIQFESCLPLQLSPLARTPSRFIDDWATSWGAYRTHFRPERDGNG